MIKPSPPFIIVRFDPVPLTAGLYIPERYKIQDGDATENTAFGVTTDRRLINPQTCEVLSGKYKGKRVFTHYGAFEIAKKYEDLTIIPETTILFLLDPIEPLPGMYLGEEVWTEGERTASGIYITPYAEQKEGIKIKLTHASGNYSPGEIVYTVDPWQYTLTYEGKKYIKLRDSEIIGVERGGEVLPTGDKLLVEYLPEPDEADRVKENDRRAGLRDFMVKHGLHYTDSDLAEIPEKKIVYAKLLAVSNAGRKRVIVDDVTFPGKPSVKEEMGDKIGCTLMLLRNRGAILPDGRWIINMDAIVAVMI